MAEVVDFGIQKEQIPKQPASTVVDFGAKPQVGTAPPIKTGVTTKVVPPVAAPKKALLPEIPHEFPLITQATAQQEAHTILGDIAGKDIRQKQFLGGEKEASRISFVAAQKRADELRLKIDAFGEAPVSPENIEKANKIIKGYRNAIIVERRANVLKAVIEGRVSKEAIDLVNKHYPTGLIEQYFPDNTIPKKKVFRGRVAEDFIDEDVSKWTQKDFQQFAMLADSLAQFYELGHGKAAVAQFYKIPAQPIDVHRKLRREEQDKLRREIADLDEQASITGATSAAFSALSEDVSTFFGGLQEKDMEQAHPKDFKKKFDDGLKQYLKAMQAQVPKNSPYYIKEVKDIPLEVRNELRLAVRKQLYQVNVLKQAETNLLDLMTFGLARPVSAVSAAARGIGSVLDDLVAGRISELPKEFETAFKDIIQSAIPFQGELRSFNHIWNRTPEMAKWAQENPGKTALIDIAGTILIDPVIYKSVLQNYYTKTGKLARQLAGRSADDIIRLADENMLELHKLLDDALSKGASLKKLRRMWRRGMGKASREQTKIAKAFLEAERKGIPEAQRVLGGEATKAIRELEVAKEAPELVRKLEPLAVKEKELAGQLVSGKPLGKVAKVFGKAVPAPHEVVRFVGKPLVEALGTTEFGQRQFKKLREMFSHKGATTEAELAKQLEEEAVAVSTRESEKLLKQTFVEIKKVTKRIKKPGDKIKFLLKLETKDSALAGVVKFLEDWDTGKIQKVFGSKAGGAKFVAKLRKFYLRPAPTRELLEKTLKSATKSLDDLSRAKLGRKEFLKRRSQLRKVMKNGEKELASLRRWHRRSLRRAEIRKATAQKTAEALPEHQLAEDLAKADFDIAEEFVAIEKAKFKKMKANLKATAKDIKGKQVLKLNEKIRAQREVLKATREERNFFREVLGEAKKAPLSVTEVDDLGRLAQKKSLDIDDMVTRRQELVAKRNEIAKTKPNSPELQKLNKQISNIEKNIIALESEAKHFKGQFKIAERRTKASKVAKEQIKIEEERIAELLEKPKDIKGKIEVAQKEIGLWSDAAEKMKGKVKELKKVRNEAIKELDAVVEHRALQKEGLGIVKGKPKDFLKVKGMTEADIDQSVKNLRNIQKGVLKADEAAGLSIAPLQSESLEYLPRIYESDEAWQAVQRSFAPDKAVRYEKLSDAPFEYVQKVHRNQHQFMKKRGWVDMSIAEINDLNQKGLLLPDYARKIFKDNPAEIFALRIHRATKARTSQRFIKGVLSDERIVKEVRFLDPKKELPRPPKGFTWFHPDDYFTNLSPQVRRELEEAALNFKAMQHAGILPEKAPYYLMPIDVADELVRTAERYTPNKTSWLGAVYDELTATQRTLALTDITLGTQTRNMAWGNIVLSWMSGGINRFSPKLFAKAARYQLFGTDSIFFDITGRAHRVSSVVNRIKSQTILLDHGVGKWVGDLAGRRETKGIYSRLLKAMRDNKITRSYFKVWTGIENNAKTQHVMNLMKQGMTFEKAVASAAESLFIYNTNRFTPFERKWMKRGMFFYSWKRFAIPYTINRLFKVPHKYRILQHAQSAIESALTAGAPRKILLSMLPDWMQLAHPMRAGIDLTTGQEFFMPLANNIPTTEAAPFLHLAFGKRGAAATDLVKQTAPMVQMVARVGDDVLKSRFPVSDWIDQFWKSFRPPKDLENATREFYKAPLDKDGYRIKGKRREPWEFYKYLAGKFAAVKIYKFRYEDLKTQRAIKINREIKNININIRRSERKQSRDLGRFKVNEELLKDNPPYLTDYAKLGEKEIVTRTNLTNVHESLASKIDSAMVILRELRARDFAGEFTTDKKFKKFKQRELDLTVKIDRLTQAANEVESAIRARPLLDDVRQWQDEINNKKQQVPETRVSKGAAERAAKQAQIKVFRIRKKIKGAVKVKAEERAKKELEKAKVKAAEKTFKAQQKGR